jgi:hypothetical protein
MWSMQPTHLCHPSQEHEEDPLLDVHVPKDRRRNAAHKPTPSVDKPASPIPHPGRSGNTGSVTYALEPDQWRTLWKRISDVRSGTGSVAFLYLSAMAV